MEFKLAIQWQFKDDKVQPMETELFEILSSIKRTGSLVQTCRHTALSYRYVWGLLNLWEKRLKVRLILKQRGRGRGTHLTQQGESLLHCYKQHTKELNTVFRDHEKAIQDALEGILLPEKIIELKMYASHDGCIETLRRILNQNLQQNKTIELKTMGSLRALEHLLNGRCHIAGFHFCADKKLPAVSRIFKPLLERIESPLIQVCNRTLGLLLQSGNPKNIRSINDLQQKNVRFINRQPRSGSRLLFDALLAEQVINTDKIHGYHQVEFTHDAVAAMIASDAADVGFANQSVAKKFKLDFIPCLNESYFLAFNLSDQQELVNQIQTLLRSKSFSEKTNGIPGYDFSACGKLLNSHKLLKKLL